MQPQTMTLFKASDGTAAVDMSVALVSAPLTCEIGSYASFTIVTPAGVSGSWSIEDTNIFNPTPLTVGWDAFPTALYSSTASQPVGSGAVTTLCTFCVARYKRLRWTPTAGTAALPATIVGDRGGAL